MSRRKTASIHLKRLQATVNETRRNKTSAPDQHGTHSIPILLHKRSYQDCILSKVKSILYGNSSVPEIVKACLELQYLYGLRISEVTSIHSRHVSINGQIQIFGKKGSANRIVTPAVYVSFWLRHRNRNEKIGDTYSRFWFYRQYAGLGLVLYKEKGKHAKVTHLFRYIQTTDSSAEKFDGKSISDKLGHKTLDNKSYYDLKENKPTTDNSRDNRPS